jgi:hypothetical protein
LRWKYRRQAIEAAQGAYNDYQQLKTNPSFNAARSSRTIAKYARSIGFWSIWFNTFITEPDVLAELLNTNSDFFPGTALNCFDSSNGYRPIPRNPGNTVDPI